MQFVIFCFLLLLVVDYRPFSYRASGPWNTSHSSSAFSTHLPPAPSSFFLSRSKYLQALGNGATRHEREKRASNNADYSRHSGSRIVIVVYASIRLKFSPVSIKITFPRRRNRTFCCFLCSFFFKQSRAREEYRATKRW